MIGERFENVFDALVDTSDDAANLSLCADLMGGIERIIDRIRTSETAGLFTSEQWPPAAVARTLIDHGIDAFQAYVCENLGSPDERVTQGSLAEIAKDSFGPLNVMILVRKARAPEAAGQVGTRLFGNPD